MGVILISVVNIDERGRLTLPKEMGLRKARAVVISAGSFAVVIPLPPRPVEVGGSWLSTKRRRGELKSLAETLGRKDAVVRAKRRRQI